LQKVVWQPVYLLLSRGGYLHEFTSVADRAVLDDDEAALMTTNQLQRTEDIPLTIPLSIAELHCKLQKRRGGGRAVRLVFPKSFGMGKDRVYRFETTQEALKWIDELEQHALATFGKEKLLESMERHESQEQRSRGK
jgi:hypothetical protein